MKGVIFLMTIEKNLTQTSVFRCHHHVDWTID